MPKQQGFLVERLSDGQYGALYYPGNKSSQKMPITLLTKEFEVIIENRVQKRVLWTQDQYKVIGFLD